MPIYLTNEQTAFIKYLTSLDLEKNNGTLAVLRRGLAGNPAGDLNLYRFIARRVPDKDRGSQRESIYYLIAALYALQPNTPEKHTETGNFGDHMRATAKKRDDLEAAERRFTVLLTARLEDLTTPLRQAVMMLKQNDLPVNWSQLFSDLLHWDQPDKWVQRTWANHFWGYEGSTENQTEPQSDENN
jgi:CRISPR type I-E-associated protein CasB/Cse2